MDLLQQYRTCLKNITNIMREQDMNEKNLDRLRAEISDLESKKVLLKASMRSSVDKQSAAQLQKMISAKRSEILSAVADVDRQIGTLLREYESAVNQARSNQDTTKFKPNFIRLNAAKSIIAKGSEAIDDVASPAIISSITSRLAREAPDAPLSDNDFEELTFEVERLLEDVPDGTFDNLFEKIISFVLLDINTFSKLKPGSRATIYVVYILAFAGLLMIEPVLFCLPYSILLMSAGYRNIRTNQKLLAFTYPYKLLEQQVGIYEDSLNGRIQAQLDRTLQSLAKKHDVQRAPLEARKAELNRILPGVENEVKNNTSFDDLMAAAQAEYDQKIEEIQQQINKANGTIARTNKFIASNDKQLEKAFAMRDSLKGEIVKTYLNPTKPGDSKLLVRSFFLGVDDSDELIEFNYDGKPTLIIYKGDSSEVNAPLINMMLMQLLANMSIISLRIAVTDTLKGGSPYAVFSPKQLSERITICATDSAVQEIIKEYHNEFQMRTKDILTTAESLDAYNEMMLQRHSLTRDYLFLFLQDPDIKTIKGQNLLQLCRSGPQLGIIPIIFVNNTQLNEWLLDTTETLLTIKDFTETFDEQLFIFDGDTQDLQFAGLSLKDNILSRIKKGLTA